MRPLLIPLVVAGLSLGCAVQDPGTPPDATRFYYPTGIAWAPSDGGGPGYLYVVSSDFDLRFNRGTVAAVDLSVLEPFLETAAASPSPPPKAPTLDAGAFITTIVKIDPFGGPLATFTKPGGGLRLFVAGREDNVLQAIDADGPVVVCAFADAGNDCLPNAVTLASSQLNQERDAYRPFVATDGNVYVTHITPIDHPYGSNTNFTATVAIVNATTMSGPGWIQIGEEASDGLAQVGQLLYIGGRAFTGDSNTTPLRRITISTPTTSLYDDPLPGEANILDSRAMAASSDGSRLYMAIRDPDGLVTLDMTPNLQGYPTEDVLNLIELPPGAGEVAVIPRAGMHDAVAITCTDDGSVALYDDELQLLQNVIHGVGVQPFGVAVGSRPLGGARLYVSVFGQGTVAVVDLPNPNDLTQAQVLLTFGPNENCLNDDVSARPPGCP